MKLKKDGGCGAVEALGPCDLLQLDGEWFRAKDMWEGFGGSVRVTLARADDCAVRDTYQGTRRLRGEPVYAWGGGYEWTVTFMRLPTDSDRESQAVVKAPGFGVASEPPAELIAAPAHDLWPRASVLWVKGADCAGCYYMPRDAARPGELVVGLEYHVRVTARNKYSVARAASGKSSVVPNAVPSSPEASSLAVVSGSQLEVFWCPPSLSAGDVHTYAVQWDDSPNFKVMMMMVVKEKEPI